MTLDAVIAQLEVHTARTLLEIGVCPCPACHTDLCFTDQPRPHRRPLVDDNTVVTIAIAAMFGVLLGWIAPALVSASIIILLLIGSWYEPTDRLAGHSACVHRMMRRW